MGHAIYNKYQARRIELVTLRTIHSIMISFATYSSYIGWKPLESQHLEGLVPHLKR